MSEETTLTKNNEPQASFIGGLVTVGAVVVGAKFIINELGEGINKAIEKGATEVRALLEEIKADVESLIGDIEKTYQNNLDITLDNLDSFTRGQIERLRSLFNEINSTIIGDIDYLDNKLKEQIRSLIDNLLSVVRSLEGMLNRTIIRAGKAVVYVFNQVLYRIVYVLLPIIAVVLIGIALIVYPFVFKGGLPGGVGGFFIIFLMIALFSVSVALLIPKSRLWFIRRTGLLAEEKWENFDDRPSIVGISPQIFKYTVVSELKIWGVNLLKGDKVPSVKIAGIEAKVKLDPAPTHETILLDVSEGSFKFDQESGTYRVVLYYGAEEGPSGEIEIQAASKPLPDLVISTFQINPIKPKRGSNVTATVKVTNQGQARADGEFAVEWWPIKGNLAGKRATTISGLNPGEEEVVSWADYAYAAAGEFETEAKVNPDHRIKESDLNNNTKSHDPKITVLELPPDLEVFDFKIVPDPDEFGTGKIYKDRPVRCSFKVRNRGEGPTKQDIEVVWEVGTDADHKETNTVRGGLAVGEECEITITYRYTTVGGPYLSVARVIPLQDEINKDNNSKQFSVSVHPLHPETMDYTIKVKTNGRDDAGTGANVYITIHGERGDSGEFGLDTPGHNDFEKDSEEVFSKTTKYLGELTKLRIRHDNTGDKPGWFLDYIQIEEKEEPRRTWYFPCFRWLAKDVDDHLIDRNLYPGQAMTYGIKVKTGNVNGAGTGANVYISLWGKFEGEKGESGEHELDTPDHNDFERNSEDAFSIATKYLGELTKLRIRHDNTGDRPGWFLDYVQVEELEGNRRTWHFPCFRWLATNEDDGSIDRELFPQG